MKKQSKRKTVSFDKYTAGIDKVIAKKLPFCETFNEMLEVGAKHTIRTKK